MIARIVVALVLLLGLAPAAHADDLPAITFAAGEQWVGWESGSFDHTDDDYFTQPRDMTAFTPRVWRLLARSGTSLSVHLRYGRDFGPVPEGKSRLADALPILRAARRHGVPMVAWLVVPYGDGYWAHEANGDLHVRVMRRFAAWARKRPFDFDSVLIDLESSIQDTRVLGKVFKEPGPAVQRLQYNVGPSAQCDAARTYAEVVRVGRARGFSVTAAAYPFFLDDIANGDFALMDGMNAPLFVPGQFDAVGFMTMRSVYLGMTGEDPGPSLQASYALDVERWFPDEGELVLGVFGVAPYDELTEAVRDVRTVAAVSDRPVNVYSLESTINAYGADGLRKILRAARRPFEGQELADVSAESEGTRLARTLIAVQDVGVAAGQTAALLSRGEAPELPNRGMDACAAP